MLSNFKHPTYRSSDNYVHTRVQKFPRHRSAFHLKILVGRGLGKVGVHSCYWSIFIILMHLVYNISLKNTLLVDFHYFNVPNVQYLCNARTVLVPYNCAQLDPKCKQREKSERGLDESL